MRDDDLTTFDPAEGDPPSPEFVSALLERLDVAWHSRTDGRGYAEAIAGAGSSIAPTNEYMGEPTMIDLETETAERPLTAPPSRRRPSARALQWAAALIVVVGVAGAAYFATRDDSPITSAGPVGPQTVVDQYFTAFNAGDVDGVVSLFTIDATLQERFNPADVFGEPDPDWEQEVAGFIAQETVLESPSCAATDDLSTTDRTLSCDYGFLDAPTQAVGALPVPVTATFAITPLGKINKLQVTYDAAGAGVDFLHVGRPFARWLSANRPEFASLAITDEPQGVGRGEEPVADCCQSMSATEVGRLRVQYAQEWAAYLEENGCTYLDDC